MEVGGDVVKNLSSDERVVLWVVEDSARNASQEACTVSNFVDNVPRRTVRS